MPAHVSVTAWAGASILLWGNDAFLPLFQISLLFPRYFRKILTFLPFPKRINIFDFMISSANISDDLFNSHWPQICNSPLYFRCFNSFPTVSGNFSFANFPSDFVEFTCFLHTLCVFRFPPNLTMIHLCITQCTYWTPLYVRCHKITSGGHAGRLSARAERSLDKELQYAQC